MTKGVRPYRKGWRWELCYNGKRYSGTTDTEEQAREQREQLQRKLSGTDSIQKGWESRAHNPKCPTLEQAVENMFNADWANLKAPHTIRINCSFLYRFFGNKRPLDTITTEDIDAFIAWLRDNGNERPTINRKLAALSKLLKRALQKEQIPKLPYIEHQAENHGRIRFITKDEEEKILSYYKSHGKERLYHAIIVLVDTGIRTGELYKLTPHDLQTQGNTNIIYLRDTKNGESRIVPLTRRAYESLTALIQTSDNANRVLGNEYPNWIDKNWNSMKKALGLADDTAFVPHILRHTCCSRLVQRGAPIKKVQQWLGHKSIQTTMRYAHLAPDDIFDMTKLLED